VTREEFAAQVADACEHLYDLVYLRTHPLLDLLVRSAGPEKKRARELHGILLEAINELDPGPQAPAGAQECRRHRLLMLRYVKGLAPQAVADQLILSLRHYFRVQSAALEDVAAILWDRYVERPPVTAAPTPDPGEDAALSRLELLRLEAARTVQADRFARLSDVVPGVLPLLAEMLRQHELQVRLQLAATLPGASVDRSLLRQMLLGLLGYLIESAQRGALVLAAQVEGTTICLSLALEPPEAIVAPPPADDGDRLPALAEMAAITGARILPCYAGPRIAGFEVRLPVAERTVLVVDDNEDVLALFRSFLSPHRYRVVTERAARAVLDRARQIQPYAITLDLMMPGQDGWDVLQSLLNHPETRHIPVIICSVLKQKELALSLGAAAFLAKPITEQALLAALEALER